MKVGGSRLLALLVVLLFAGRPSALASADRASTMAVSNQLVRIQRDLQKTIRTVRSVEMNQLRRMNVFNSLQEAESALENAQGYLTAGTAAD